MKKTLSIILSFVLLVTSLVCIFTNGFMASATVGYEEDFESYSVGTDMAADDALTWKVYDEGENGYFKGKPGSNGWFAGAAATNLLVSSTKATTTGGKAMAIPSWGVGFKEIAVQPNMDYTLTFKFNADAVDWKDFAVYDVSNVTADGYSLKAYTSFTPVNAANRLQYYDKTLLTTYAWERNKTYTANTWTEYTAKFTTSSTASKIVIAFAYEGSGNMYIDDISLTYVVNTEANAIFKDGSFENAVALAAGSTVANANGVRATEWKNNKPSINTNGWVGSHYGNGNILLGGTTYNTSAGSITTPAAKDGTHIMRLTTEWHTIAKVINVKANTSYALSYWYYADSAEAKFMDNMDFAIGLNANATTITIPVTHYEADGVTIKDCGGDILADGTDGQTKINYEPAAGDDKTVVNQWTKRTLYFNSGSFTKIAIPFYHKKNNVYIDNVSVQEYVDLKVTVKVSGADTNNAGIANVTLSDDESTLTYTAKAFSNAVFTGWYDGNTLVESAATFTKAYDPATYKQLEARFDCLYANEFDNGYFDDMATGTNVVEGQTIATQNTAQVSGSWKYTFTVKPGTLNWMTNQNAYNNIPVVVKEYGTDTTNKALQIQQWANLGRIVEVKPNHKYILNYDYYLPTGCEFGNFNIYNVSNVTDNTYIGYDNLTNSTSNQFLYVDSSKNKFPEMGNNYKRLSAKADGVDADGNPVDSHDTWITRTCEFETDENTTKILIVWNPEGNQPMYIDNVVLSSTVIPKVNVVVTGEDTTNAGGAYAKLNDAQTEITYVASAYPNGKFLGWYKNGSLYETNETFKEAFNPNNYEVIEARFECTYKNRFTGDAGFDATSVGANLVAGATCTERTDLKYVIVNGYDKSSADAEAKAEADVQKLQQAGISAKVVTKAANGVNYAAVAVNPTDTTVQTNAASVLGNPANPIPEGSKYLYVFNSSPNEAGWYQHTTAAANVVEKATDKNALNHALQIPLWGKIGRVIDVVPNSDYQLTFDYYMAMYVEFGSVVIYDVSNVDTSVLFGRDDVLNDLNTDYKFKPLDNSQLRILASWRSAGKGGAEDVSIHDKWVTQTLNFSADLKTNKILIVWAPEGNTNPGASYADGSPKPVPSDTNLYLDNIIVAGKELDYPIRPVAGAGQEEMGGVYPDTGYIPVGESEATLTFMASPLPGNKFVKWQLNGVDVAGAAGTNPVYTGTFNKNTKLTPVFAKVGEGNPVVNPGAETVTSGTNLLDNKNNPTIPGSWFAAWSSDGSDGNGYSAKYLEVDDKNNPRPGQTFWTKITASSEEARSGNNSVKFEKMSYQILGRDITGLKKNTRYLLSFWVKFTSESSYMQFVSVSPKAVKDEQWQNGECYSSNLNTHGVGGKALAYLVDNDGLDVDGVAQGWQKISIAFNTGSYDAVTLTLQMVDPKGKATALYIDDLGVEVISASQKLVNANATYNIGGISQTSAGNGLVKPGELTMFYAIPDTGMTFKGWYKPGTTTNPVSTNRYYVVNLNSDLSYEAQFNVVEIKLQSYELGGYATVDKTGVFASGTVATFTATPDEGNTFAGWYNAATNTLVSTDLVYTAPHYESIALIAKFNGYNKPAREVLGLNGFENMTLETNIKETWMDSIVDYQIFADGDTDNSWTFFTVSNRRAYAGEKALYCSNRWRYTRLQLTGLNKNTTYKIKFKYHMQEEDESAKMYTYIGPMGITQPDTTTNQALMYIYDAAGLGGGRGWDTYELTFNSGELSELEFGIKFEAATPPFSGNEAYLNPWAHDQSNMYIDDLELWEYSANDTIKDADFEGSNKAWLSNGSKTTFIDGVANIPANSTLYQAVTVKPFTQYLLTFEAEAGALEAGAIDVECGGVNSYSIISSIASTSITNTAMNKYTIAFTTGNEEAINIAFTNKDALIAKVDNVSLTVDTVGYSEGVIEKVDFESERFAVNNFLITDPDKEHILKCANEAPFQNEGFEIYTATSANDKNVLSGNKSLKILPQEDTEVAHKLWQTWMNFPAASLKGNYLITFNYRFENAKGGAIYLAGDAKDRYVQEHTIYAQDDKWHTASFSIDNTEGLIYIKAAVGTIAGNAGSAIYIDDIVYQLHPAMITEGTTRYTYCENLYNAVENSNFEDKITSADWSGMPSTYSIAVGGAFTEQKYLKAGVSSTTYTKVVEVDPSAAYYVGVSLRGAKGTKGKVSLMASNVTGNNVLFTDVDKTVNSTFTYKGEGEWERYGFKFVTPSNGKIAIVIDTRNGAIDVDNIMIFPIKFKYTYDPNDYYNYKPYDYTDMSNVIINGGVGEQPYYDGDLTVGRDKDPYAAQEKANNVLIYNPTHSQNPLFNVIALLISVALGLFVVSYLIVKSKKKEVK